MASAGSSLAATPEAMHLPAVKVDTADNESKLTEEFGIPLTEVLVLEATDVQCKTESKDKSEDDEAVKQQGSLFMFKNYLCFKVLERPKTPRSRKNSDNGKMRDEPCLQWSLPLREVRIIEKASTAIVLGNGIRVITGELRYSLTVHHRDQVLSTLLSLWEVSKAMVEIQGPCPAPTVDATRARRSTVSELLEQSLEAPKPDAAAERAPEVAVAAPVEPKPSAVVLLVQACSAWLPVAGVVFALLVCVWLVCVCSRLSSLRSQMGGGRQCVVGAVSYTHLTLPTKRIV
eukprot:TRINITY_DN2135_c0_g1_i1.p1 TRINITY_DN2135_c0_g1~~TRINITY_DN2135_c0_g1_i1.p1  ORF type:complete len:288 (-),score=88.90 TRINITY_DN2135_c0_g1_i1:125-988(-)